MNIRKLFGLCEHKWTILNTVNLTRFAFNPDNSINEKSRHRTGFEYHMQCEKCGFIKIIK